MSFSVHYLALYQELFAPRRDLVHFDGIRESAAGQGREGDSTHSQAMPLFHDANHEANHMFHGLVG